MFFLIITSTSCILSKRATDRSIKKSLTKNPARVKEAAEFAVSVTYGKKETSFEAKDVVDKDMREKINRLGSSVRVHYKDGDYSEIPDSNVTFVTITLFGVTEIIYDFASVARNFTDQTNDWKQYYFVKISDRIYYRRRPVPMM